MDYGNIRITQYALKVSVFMMLKLDTIQKKTKKKKKSHFAVCGDHSSKLIKLSWSSEKKHEQCCLQCNAVKKKKWRKSNQKHLGEKHFRLGIISFRLVDFHFLLQACHAQTTTCRSCGNHCPPTSRSQTSAPSQHQEHPWRQHCKLQPAVTASFSSNITRDEEDEWGALSLSLCLPPSLSLSLSW